MCIFLGARTVFGQVLITPFSRMIVMIGACVYIQWPQSRGFVLSLITIIFCLLFNLNSKVNTYLIFNV